MTVGPSGQVITVSATTTLIVIPGLANGVTYTFSVVATNSVGSSTPSTIETTLACLTVVLGSLPVLDGNTTEAGGSGSNSGLVILTGDFNGDGRPDLLVQDDVRHPLWVYLNQGDGGLGTPIPSATVSSAALRAVALRGDGGSLDLVFLDANNYIAKAPGRGDGTFGDPVEISPIAVFGSAFFVADVNGDGIPDLIDLNSNTDVFTTFFGAFDGGYPTEQSTTVARSETQVLMRDLDHDGKADLILNTASSSSPGAVFFMHGNGDGTFADAGVNQAESLGQSYLAGDPTPQLVDVDGDGNLDFLVSVHVPPSSGSADPFGILIAPSDGHGGWKPLQFYSEPYPYGTTQTYNDELPSILNFAVGDFTGDGRLDLAAVYNGAGMAIFTQLDDGGFSNMGALEPALGSSIPSILPATFATGDGTPGLVAADLNGDGLADLVGGSSLMNIYYAIPGGGFQVPTSYRAFDTNGTASYYDLAYADVNGDGIPDIIALGQLNGGAFQVAPFGFLVFTGQTDGGLSFHSESVPFPDTAVVLTGMALGDLNHDGNLDLMAFANSPSTELYTLLGSDGGSFNLAHTTAFGSPIVSAGVGDFDTDGNADVAVETNTSLFVLAGYGDGGLAPAQLVTSGSFTATMTVGDFNGDGVPDIVAGSAVYLSTGAFSFETISLPIALGDEAPILADVNHDGLTDLVGYSRFGGASFVALVNAGDGGFSQNQVDPFVEDELNNGKEEALAPHNVAVADMDQDGNPDAIMSWSDGQITVAYGHGDGPFDPPAAYLASPTYDKTGAGALVVVDLDGDGRPDAVTEGGLQLTVSMNHFSPVCWGQSGQPCDLNGSWNTGSSTVSITQSGLQVSTTGQFPLSNLQTATYWGDAVSYGGDLPGFVSADCNTIDWGNHEVWSRP